MSQNLDNPGLRSIFNQYNLFYIDIWGVIHNGVEIFNDSLEVLQNLKNENKEFVLLTNAPRPNLTVINFLKKIGLKATTSEKIGIIGNNEAISVQSIVNLKDVS